MANVPAENIPQFNQGLTQMASLVSLRKSHDPLTTFLRRDKVVKTVGYDNLSAFEMWAFKASEPETYDFNLAIRWNLAHLKTSLEIDPDKALDKILSIWTDRFSDGSIKEEKVCFVTLGNNSSDDEIEISKATIFSSNDNSEEST